MLLLTLEALSYLWVLAVLGFTGFGYMSYLVNMKRVKLLKIQEAALRKQTEELAHPSEYTVVRKTIGSINFWSKEKYKNIYLVLSRVLSNANLKNAVTIEFPGHVIPAKGFNNVLAELCSAREDYTINDACKFEIVAVYHIPKDTLA